MLICIPATIKKKRENDVDINIIQQARPMRSISYIQVKAHYNNAYSSLEFGIQSFSAFNFNSLVLIYIFKSAKTSGTLDCTIRHHGGNQA